MSRQSHHHSTGRSSPLEPGGSQAGGAPPLGALNALRESEIHFRTLFESSRDAMLVLGSNGRFSAGNPAARKMFDCKSLEEFASLTPVQLSPERQPDGRPSALAAREWIDRAKKTGACTFEWRHRSTSGTEFDASVQLVRMELDGETQLYATVRDISATKAVQMALRANEQKLRTITESALDAIIMVDSEGRINHWNSAAQTMFGYSADEVLGKDPHAFLAFPARSEAAPRPLANLASSESGADVGRIMELTARRSDGSEIPVEMSVSAVRGDQGLGAVAIIRDVSDRKRLEAAFQQQTAELSQRVRELNCLEQAAEVFEKNDLTPADMIRRLVAFLPFGMRSSEHVAARIVFQGAEFCSEGYQESPVQLTVPLVVDGKRVGSVEVSYMACPAHAADEPFTSRERTLLDQIAARLARAIERRQSYQQVTTLSRELEVILEATGTRLLLVDDTCAVQYADPATQRCYGLLANQKCHRYLCLSSERCTDCPNEYNQESSQPTVSFQRLPAETDRIFQRTIVPIRVEQNRRLFAELLVDVTELKAMETNLNQARKLEAVGQLAAGIAHEINTPTQFIGDNTRFLRDGVRDLEQVMMCVDRLIEAAGNHEQVDSLLQETRKTLDEIDAEYLRAEIPVSLEQTLDGISQIATIVRAMKEFSHPGTKEVQWIDLNRAVANTLTVSRNEWKHVAEVVTEFAPDLPLVPCFPADLNQAVLNILMNAAHAIEAKDAGNGTITVRTRSHRGWVEIQISDTGTGIPENIRSRVFDHFFTTKQVGKGTGQGLTIAHAVVVEKHGGTLDFQTEVGVGTTFLVRLPLQEAAARTLHDTQTAQGD